MGMSASQGRFLMLTAQKSNNEFQAQSITFQRMMLAENVDGWTEEYNDAMQNRTLLYGQANQNSTSINYNARLHYDDIIRSDKEGGMSMSLVSATSNKIVVPSLPDPMPEGKTRDDYFLCPDVNDADFLEKKMLGAQAAPSMSQIRRRCPPPVRTRRRGFPCWISTGRPKRRQTGSRTC